MFSVTTCSDTDCCALLWPPFYAGGEANLYVHHDLLLPAFPLSLAWMDLSPTGGAAKANMVAISSMEPCIEIWDLDVTDQVEPVVTLGGIDTTAAAAAAEAAAAEAAAKATAAAGGSSKEAKAKAKKKAKKAAAKAQKAFRPGSHTDAVLGLSWNREFRNVLASGSADTTVKVWDVVAQKCEHTLTHHSDKVQAVAWNPVEAPVLLTGAFDRTACLVSWGGWELDKRGVLGGAKGQGARMALATWAWGQGLEGKWRGGV